MANFDALKKSQQLQQAGTTGVSAPKTTQQKIDANIARREERKITPERQRQIEEAQRRANQRAQTQARSQKELNQLNQVTKDVMSDPSLANLTTNERNAEILRRKEAAKMGMESTQQAQTQADISKMYGQQLESGYAKATGMTREGELFEGYRQKSIAQQKAGMGALPTRPELAEDATYEDRLKAEADYQKLLSQYYQGELGKSQEELGTVSGQVTSLADQITKNQGQINELINSLNAKDPQKGQQLQSAIQDISSMGLDGEVTPESINQISTLIEQGIQPMAAVQQAFGVGAPAPAMDQYMPGADIGAFTAPEIKAPSAPMEAPQVMPKKEPEPFKPDGSIVNTQYGVSLTGNTYQTASGIQIPRNINTGFPDYNALPPDVAANLSSYDLFSIDVATGQYQMAMQNADLQAFYTADALKKMTDRVARDSKTYYDQITSTFDSAEAKVSQEKVFALQEQELASQRLDLERDLSLQSLNDGHAKNEALMKAMIDAYGLEGSSAQLAIMGNLDLKYRQQLSQTKKAYAIEGAQIALNSSKIRFDFANQLVELTNKKNTAIETARNELTDRLDEIDSMRLASQIERTQSRNAAYQQLAQQKGQIVQDAQAREAEAQKAAMDRMFEIQMEGIKSSGYIPTIGPDGQISFMTGPDGRPLINMEEKKFMQGVNEFERKFALDERKYWDSIKKMDVKWDDREGAWIGFDQFGNKTNLGDSGVSVPNNSKFTFNVGDNSVRWDVPVGQALPNRWECGQFVNDALFGGPGYVGDDFKKDKMKWANSPMPVAGGAFFEKTKSWTGHTGLVEKVYPDGSFDIIESNYTKDAQGRGIIERSHITPGSPRYSSIVEQGGFYDPNPGSPKSNAVPYMNKDQKSNYLTLKNQYRTRPEVQEFKAVQSSYSKIQSVTPTPAGDISLVFNFMKMLDPGSVVREGEFANAANAAGVPEQVRNQYNRIINGTLLGPEGDPNSPQRLDFKTQAKNIFNSQKEIFNNVLQEFKQDALIVGLPENIDYNLGTIYEIQDEPEYTLPEDLNEVNAPTENYYSNLLE